MNKDYAINKAKNKNKAIEWYIPRHIGTISQQDRLSRQILNRTPTELQYVETTVFMKEVNTQKLWTFELSTDEGINVPTWIIVGFQQKVKQDSQNLHNDTFYRPPVTSAQCIIGTEKNTGNSMLLNYDGDDYSQGYGKIK